MADPTAPAATGDATPATAGIERRAMAWPPMDGERAAGAWRDDVPIGLEPFEAFIPAPPVPAGSDDPRALESAEAGPATRRLAGPLREAFEIGAMALLLFGLIRVAAQNYLIERESMLPTLDPGDMVLVDKLGYRFGHGPRRGDVVVFHAWPQAGEKDFVKRVVAVPGDAVAVRGGRLEIDGTPVDEPYLGGARTEPDAGPIALGPNDYYVLGDNRQNSVDSRSYGPLPRDRIVGRAWLVYWPPSAFGPLPRGPVDEAAPDAGDGADGEP